MFDAIIQNVDRRSENPNCLVRGDLIRIFDHELAFQPRTADRLEAALDPRRSSELGNSGAVIFSAPGWLAGQSTFSRSGTHGRTCPTLGSQPMVTSFPSNGQALLARVTKALTLIRDARDNIDACLREVRRVLA